MSRDLLMVVDVGNTNTVLGLYDGTELIDTWRFATNPRATTDELGVLYLSLFAARKVEPERIRAAICSSVVPPAVHATRRAGQRYFGVDVCFVGEDVMPDIAIRYDNPAEVGADRIVNAVAAYTEFGTACVVVDFGTATTFDVVASDGAYEGGVIAPGIGISLEALFHRASKLPRVEIRKPASVIGKRTVEAMQAGIVVGYVGLVDGIVSAIIDELDTETAVIATGGLANLIGTDSEHIRAIRPFLTLEGLRLIHERHCV